MNKTRRAFIQSILAGGASLFSTLALPNHFSIGSVIANEISKDKSQNRSKIVLTRSPKLKKEDGNLNIKYTSMILDDALMKITVAKSPVEAWSTLFVPDDIVAIKINALAGKPFSPHIGLVESIVEGVKLAGVKEKNIIIFDRLDKELVKAGYEIKKDKNLIKCLGTDGLAGSGYDDQPQINGSIGSCFSKIISNYATAIINVPVLKDHDLSGVSVGMKNFYGVIHNPNKYHDNNCDPYIADLNSHPFIRKKLRLVVCDAIKAQYNGGPAFKPQWVWDFGGLIVGTDPVAMDQTGYKIIKEKRDELGLPSLKQAGREPKYIQTAAAMGLGFANEDNIDLIET